MFFFSTPWFELLIWFESYIYYMNHKSLIIIFFKLLSKGPLHCSIKKKKWGRGSPGWVQTVQPGSSFAPPVKSLVSDTAVFAVPNRLNADETPAFKEINVQWTLKNVWTKIIKQYYIKFINKNEVWFIFSQSLYLQLAFEAGQLSSVLFSAQSSFSCLLQILTL